MCFDHKYKITHILQHIVIACANNIIHTKIHKVMYHLIWLAINSKCTPLLPVASTTSPPSNSQP